MNRLFTKQQRRHLYISQDGLCGCCSGELSQGWEAHHKVRYTDGGVTETYNGIALCRECHVKKHKEMKDES